MKQRRIALVVAVIIVIGAVVALENPFRSDGTGIVRSEENVEAETGIQVGDRAPDFALRSQRTNEVVRLSDFRGQNVVINFWATWCPFCLDEMPKFEEEMSERDVVVIGVNLQETDIAKMNRFADELGVTYPLLLDPSGDVRRTYNVFTQPVTYFIDENGVIVDRKFGPLTDAEIEKKFAELVAA